MITKIDDIMSENGNQTPNFPLEYDTELQENFNGQSKQGYNKGFVGDLGIYNKDVALKTLLYTLLFYIVNSGLVRTILNKIQFIVLLGTDLVQAIILGVLFYIISFNL